MTNKFDTIIDKLTNSEKVSGEINTKELNLYRAAGLTFNVGNNEFIVIPPKKYFDIDNPGKTIDTSKMIEELQYLISFVGKISIKLSNKEFTSRAPEKVIEMEYKKINDSMSKIRIIKETLDFIYNISSELEKKELLKKSVTDSLKFNDKQKELLINEIEDADEYFINILEEKIIND
jgi:valyl-tRNA synthetase